MLEPLKLGSNALSCYHKRSRGGIPATAGWLIGQAGSVQDEVMVRFGLRRAKGQIVDARYEVFGGPAAIAAAAWAAERVTEAATVNLSGRQIAEALDLPVEKTGVTLVVEDAIREALTADSTRAQREYE